MFETFAYGDDFFYRVFALAKLITMLLLLAALSTQQQLLLLLLLLQQLLLLLLLLLQQLLLLLLLMFGSQVQRDVWLKSSARSCGGIVPVTSHG